MLDKTFQLRIPTTQYGYIEETFTGECEEAIAEHNKMIKLYSGVPLLVGPGLPEGVFNMALDRYLTVRDCDANVYEAMNREQKDIFQAIKRSYKRTSND